ncbi:phosphatase PAP2 family protein [Pseudorhodobacter sp.]|uniref:phosphatase PAP2 family protein n=1 Tax=Pseudorhodobacter sp. TaxID=1934400 RepID=UPI002649D45A|nr:phosphatase PAP2 family protein [Pseudorhodobacter sp.]MDN5788075.1 phosphatase PAP2 family protein [Pseudorhodobacter sp.]
MRCSSYITILALTALNVAILAFSRAELLTSTLPMFVAQGIILLVIFVTMRRLLNKTARAAISLLRLHYAVEGLFFLHIAWLNLRLLNHLSMMLPFPYADTLLAGWDQALHLDWLSYFNAVLSLPQVFHVLDVAYTSLTLLSVVVLLLLVSCGYIARAREFIDTFFVTAMICILVGAAFPAKAAVLTLIPDLSIFAQMGWIPGSYHIAYLEELRDPSAPLVLNPANLPGLATFPSFHTASGILIISACRKTWLSAPAWIYATVMISATPVLGGHYIVDLIAGVLVAVLVVTLLRRVNRESAPTAQLQHAVA